MTAYEVVQTVRMMLDDSVDWSMKRSLGKLTINDIINKAQMQLIAQGYKSGDERMLRPLYRVIEGLPYGYRLTDVNRYLYPRALYINYDANTSTPIKQVTGYPFSGTYATYLDYDEYVIYEDFEFIGPNINTPARAMWTVVDNNTLLFSRGVDRQIDADIMFIAKPLDFLHNDSNMRGDINLSIPSEYHLQVCMIAAHIINNSDVNEYQREQQDYNGAKLRFKDLTLNG